MDHFVFLEFTPTRHCNSHQGTDTSFLPDSLRFLDIILLHFLPLLINQTLSQRISKMCLAELSVSTLDCRHRWYHLVRSCSSSTNLENCPDKLKIEGWESKTASCPWCDQDTSTDPQEYRLVGNDKTPSIGGLSRASSTTNIEPTLISSRHESRRGSLARTDSSTSLTEAAGERNRAQNMRIQWYLTTRLEAIAQEETKERPTTSRRSSATGLPLSPTPTNGSSSTTSENGGIFGKGWKKGKQISRGFFR